MNKTKTATLEDLYSITGKKIHQKARANSRRSHLKFIDKLSGFAYEDFIRFVTDRYLNALRKNKKFPFAYTLKVIQTIQSTKKLNSFTKWDFARAVQTLNKIYNRENKDKIFYTPEGLPYDFADVVANTIASPDNPNQCSDPTTSDQFQISSASIRQAYEDVKKDEQYTVYDSSTYENIKRHYHERLLAFLATDIMVKPTKHDELSLLLVMLITCPKRVNEILKLTMDKVHQLILNQQTLIRSKDGVKVQKLIIPFGLAEYLESYIQHLGNQDTLFNYQYSALYPLFRRDLKTIFNYDKMSRPFHGFRNYFADQHRGDFEQVKKTLGHTRSATTSMYAAKQSIATRNTVHEQKVFLNKTFPFLKTEKPFMKL